MAVSRQGEPQEVLPPELDASCFLHGYPGRGWLAGDEGLLLPGASDPDVVLGEPCLVGSVVVAVREQSSGPERSLVAVEPASGEMSVLWAGSSFVGGLEAAPDGRGLSWLAWDDPDMPWDSARLMVGYLVGRDLDGVRVLAGGWHRSAQPAAWTSATTLLTSTEETGRWQLCEIDVGSGEVLRRWEHVDEVGIPYWRAGARSIVAGRRGAAVLAGGRLWRVGPDRLEPLDPQGFWAPWLAAKGDHVLGIRESDTARPALTRVDLGTGQRLQVHPRPGGDHEPARRPQPRELSVAGEAGSITVRLYAPCQPAPWPTVLVVHGGPTIASTYLLDPSLEWLVEEGFAVAVVDYSGSAGHGRQFRNALYGRWGDLEVDDCERVARYLRVHGLSRRIAIRGVSSGGWTVLHALSRAETPFAGGVAYAPVTDVAAQRAQTPDFEKHYVDRLMGAVERSPAQLGLVPRRRLLIVQGDLDQIVRPATTERYVRQLGTKGEPVEYLRIPGEGHLLSSDDGISRARAAELALYRRALLRDDLMSSP